MPIIACAAAADSDSKPDKSTLQSQFGKLNLLGIEYITFAFLMFWGVMLVSLNYFLWMFRWVFEVTGLAPDSWYFKDQKKPKRLFFF